MHEIQARPTQMEFSTPGQSITCSTAAIENAANHTLRINLTIAAAHIACLANGEMDCPAALLSLNFFTVYTPCCREKTQRQNRNWRNAGMIPFVQRDSRNEF